MINAQNSTYDNYILNFSAYPAIEYNLFPYSESSKHIVRIYYGVSPVTTATPTRLFLTKPKNI